MSIIGPFIFQGDWGSTTTVDLQCYWAIITDFVMPIRKNDIELFWFQQDVAYLLTQLVFQLIFGNRCALLLKLTVFQRKHNTHLDCIAISMKTNFNLVETRYCPRKM